MVTATPEMKYPNLIAALAAFQSDAPTIANTQKATVHTQKGPGYSYEYADLATVVSIVIPKLGKVGLAWFCETVLDEQGRFILRSTLAHESGEKRESVYPLPPAGSPEQMVGKVMTYARRYTLLALVGLASGGEDEGGEETPAYESGFTPQNVAPAPSRAPGSQTRLFPAPTPKQPLLVLNDKLEDAGYTQPEKLDWVSAEVGRVVGNAAELTADEVQQLLAIIDGPPSTSSNQNNNPTPQAGPTERRETDN